jgi:pimeloyl-ACP methyl ester carboxylesterase
VPTVEREGATLYYETDGEESDEVVAFVAEAGLGAWSWGWQHAAVTGPHRSLVFDHRGTGRSTGDPPADGWDAATLSSDLDAVLRDAGARRAHLVGLGLGGMVALHYALDRGRAASLALVGTAARGAAVDRDALSALLRGETNGLSAEFAAERPAVVEQIRQWRAGEDAPERAWRAQVAALDGFDATDRLHEVTVPALVCHGGADAVVPASAGEALAEGLPRGEFRGFDGAGHLVTVERSRPLNDALVAHLDAA